AAPSHAVDLADLFQVRRLSETVEAEVTTTGEERVCLFRHPRIGCAPGPLTFRWERLATSED
ncbi:hypothetical protein ACWDNT_03920, partial [Streptomyces sp. NPDC000963]